MSSVPDRFGSEPVLAWRRWAISRAKPDAIYSPVYTLCRWKPGVRNEATCTRCDEVPALDHSCGFYGHATKEEMARSPYAPISTATRFIVFGQVSLWGNVIEHERGYRAQYAYPYDLTLIRSKLVTGDDRQVQQIIQRLRALYAVDVQVQ